MKKVNKDGNSRAEVYKILEQMQTLVLTEMEGELINMSHNTFLLARQLIRQVNQYVIIKRIFTNHRQRKWVVKNS